DDGATVTITIEKDGHTTQVHTVNTSGASQSVKGSLNRKNQNQKTIFASAESDINTDGDLNEKGEAIPRCHIVITSGAVAGDTEVELSPYYSLDNLPVPLPSGYIGLAGADFSASSIILFVAGKEAKPYLALPSTINAAELTATNIKLMELVETNGVSNWVVSKNGSNQDRACKYYSSGQYTGMLGPDDGVLEDNQAKLKGVRAFCFVYYITQVATINGKVRNTAGTPVGGTMVFGGGSAATTDSAGNYSLQRVIALNTGSSSLVMVNAIAPGYQLASAAASVAAGGTVNNVNITLETLEEVVLVGGKVTDTATTQPIAGAKVTCTTNPYIAAFTYDNKGTATDFMDDVFSATPKAGILSYKWHLTS
ncbi:MAG: carboxypeptidase-like regulatory domain-containing protein, partial [Planctomycetota bacterium]